MSRPPWYGLTLLGLPVIGGAVLVSATFGVAGAVAYGLLLLAGINVPRLFITRKDDR